MKQFSWYHEFNFDNNIHTDVKYGNSGYALHSASFSKKYNRDISFLARSNWIVNGANNYSHTIFDDVEYVNKSWAEDVIFNRDVTIKYGKTIFLDEKLVDIKG